LEPKPLFYIDLSLHRFMHYQRMFGTSQAGRSRLRLRAPGRTGSQFLHLGLQDLP
jgi:hypothetical protein